jgi:hypothetical protein
MSVTPEQESRETGKPHPSAQLLFDEDGRLHCVIVAGDRRETIRVEADQVCTRVSAHRLKGSG